MPRASLPRARFARSSRLKIDILAPAAVLLFLLANTANATTNFVRTRLSDPVDSLTVSTGATALSFTNGDDGSQSVPLPFTFSYVGTPWFSGSFVVVSINGYAWFSSSAVQSTSSPDNSLLYTTTSPNTTLAPWFDDLSLNAVGSNPPGQVLYQTRGSVGSRSLVIQWTNVSSWHTATNGQPRRLTFQLILHETSNVIDYLYAAPSGVVGNSMESASIGLEFSPGGVGNFQDAITGSTTISYKSLDSGRWPVSGFRFSPGTPGALVGGTYTVGTGGDFPTLSEAVATLNHRGIVGPLSLSLTDAEYDSTRETFPILLGRVPGSGPGVTVTIESASGSSVLSYGGSVAGSCGTSLSASAITATNEPILGLVGSHWVTVRGLELQAVGPARVDRGLLVMNASSSMGCRYDLVEDVVVRLSRDNLNSIGLEQQFTGSASDTGAVNSWNSYRHLTIENAARGIYLHGISAQPDRGGSVIGNANGPTTVGGAAAADIRMTAGASWGVRVSSQFNFRLSGCEIRNIGTAVSGEATGIWVDNSGTTFGLCEVSANRVHGIKSTGDETRGIRAVMSTGSGSSTRIYNNMITDIDVSAPNSLTSTRALGLESTTGVQDVHFNSIRIAPTVNCRSGCIVISGSTVRTSGNVLANFAPPQTGTAVHVIWHANPLAVFCDNNVIHLANWANGYYGLSGGVTGLALVPWRAQTGHPDLHSQTMDPGFVSATDLHIAAGSPTPVEGRGVWTGSVASWLTTDIDGDPRDPTTPDIGADEGTFLPWPDLDDAVIAISNPQPGSSQAVGSPFTPVATIQTRGATPTPATLVRFRIVGPLPSTTEAYNEVASLPALLPGDTLTVTFPETSLPAAGTFTMYARSELAGDGVPGNDELSAPISAPQPLAGSYFVGATQPPPFNTLNSALVRLGTVGASSHVFFELTDPLYTTPAETFPITISSWPGDGPGATLTIRPAAGATPMVRAQAEALFNLEAVDYLTIDGSNAGSTDRSLTLNTLNGGGNYGVGVWIRDDQYGHGSSYNTIRNVRFISTMDPLQPGATSTGILIAGPFSPHIAGAVDTDHCVLENNDIRQFSWGISVSGIAEDPNVGMVIQHNVIGPPTVGSDIIGRCGIALRFQDGAIVRDNLVQNVGRFTYGGTIGEDRIGIAIGDYNLPTKTLTLAVNCIVDGNRIHGVVDQGTRTAIGILLAPQPGASLNRISNNMIDGVRANSTGSGQTVGIEIAGSSSGDTIAGNSVLMTGDLDPPGSPTATQSACALRIASSSVTNLTLVDNILSINVNSNDAQLKHFAISVPATTVSFSSTGLDHNDYDPGSSNTQVVLGGIGSSVPYQVVPTLAGWQAQFQPVQDGASISVPTPFRSSTDLHLVSSAVTPIRGGGIPVPGMTTDFDGEERDPVFPDIGADEVGPLPQLSIGDVLLPEGNIGDTPFAFRLSLSAPSLDSVSVVCTTVAVSASPDTDFVSVPIPALVTFAPGETLRTTVVNVHGDQLAEPDEVFEVHLSGAVGAALSDSIGTGTILNDDGISGIGEPLPGRFFLGPIQPNPVRRQAIIQFNLEQAERVRLDLFDVRGRHVETILDQDLPQGRHEITWNPRDDQRAGLPSGCFFLRLHSSSGTATRRVVILGDLPQVPR